MFISLEVAEKNELKFKSIHEKHRHPGALPDKHNHLPPDEDPEDSVESEELLHHHHHSEEEELSPHNAKHLPHQPLLEYKYPDRNTEGMIRLQIGGRGPGKGRHKGGPGGARLDAELMDIARPDPFPAEGYPLDGVCACSTYDPKYPDRVRPDYGMDFVEDQLRKRWCVAAPGNLCGRIYFRKNLWPGQNFEMSDHIGCPKKYNGKKYECVRWQLESNLDEDEKFKKLPNTLTSTCEVKLEDRNKNVTNKTEPKPRSTSDNNKPNCILPYFIFCFILSNVVKIIFF